MFDGRHLSLGRTSGDRSHDETTDPVGAREESIDRETGDQEIGDQETGGEEIRREGDDEDVGPEETDGEKEVGDVAQPAMRFARMRAR